MKSSHTNNKTVQRTRRHARIRAKVVGTAERPRLAVYRSNTALYAQIIDDNRRHTICATDTRAHTKGTLREKAVLAGNTLAEQAKKAGIKTVVFDRGGMRYTGNIEAFADAVRAGGLIF